MILEDILEKSVDLIFLKLRYLKMGEFALLFRGFHYLKSLVYYRCWYQPCLGSVKELKR